MGLERQSARHHTPGRLDALLCSMPFGMVSRPSAALGILQALATRAGASARSRYFSLSFAGEIGHDAYALIAHGLGLFGVHEVGQWLFAASLSPELEAQSDRYVNEILRRAAPPCRPQAVPEHAIETLLRARERVPAFLERAADEVLERAPRLVGFSCGPQQRVPSLALARRIKARAPGTSVIFGGCDCEGVMGAEIAQRYPFVDAVVSGAGDVVFPEILVRVMDGRPIDGIPGVYTRAPESWRGPRARAAPEPDLDTLPFPDFDDYFAALAAEGERPEEVFLPVETARGCWWADRGRKCAFCSESPGGLRFRSKSPARALAELEHLAGRYAVPVIALTDRAFDRSYLSQLVPQLRERPLPASVFIAARASLSKEDLCALRDAGVHHLCLGIESLSTKVLRLMRKGTTMLENIQTLKWARSLGLNAYWNVLWGLPGEPAIEYEMLATLVPRLVHLPPPSVATQIALMRDSPLFEEAERLGLTGVAPAPAYAHLYPFAPEVLARLAFYFEYAYRVPQDVDATTRSLKVALEHWRSVHSASSLLTLRDAGSLWVLDERPGAPQHLAVLEGLERVLVEACDERRDVSVLWRSARAALNADIARSGIEASLAALEERWLVIREGRKWLSLAVPAATDAERDRIRRAARAS